MFNKFLLIFLVSSHAVFISSEDFHNLTSKLINQVSALKNKTGRPRLNEIYLCCEPDEMFNKKTCEKDLTNIENKIEIPKIYSKSSFGLIESNKSFDELFFFHLGIPCEDVDSIFTLEFGENTFMLENGTIFDNLTIPSGRSFQFWTSNKDYCLSNVYTDNVITPTVIYCDPASIRNPIEKKLDYLNSIGELLSAPFLGLTFLVYLILPELRKSLHGKTVTIYVGCLFATYTLFGFVEYNKTLDEHRVACTLSAYAVYFASMSSFFWLNVMSFDLWSTFRGNLGRLSGSRRKFIIYSLYAWGFPTLLTTICLIMDFANVPKNFIKPEFGVVVCWFLTMEGESYYFYVPLALTVFCNIGLFISTARKIRQLKQETTEQLKGEDSCRHDDNEQRFSLYLKLFLIMGINWATEVISWAVQHFIEINYIWYITDLANSFQGVTIFIIFVCTKKVRDLLLQRFCRSRKLSRFTNNSMSTSPESSYVKSKTNSSTKSNLRTSNL